MKVVYEFNLPDDKSDLEVHQKSWAHYGVLQALANEIRQKVKYSEEDLIPIEEVHEEFWRICNEFDVDPLG